MLNDLSLHFNELLLELGDRTPLVSDYNNQNTFFFFIANLEETLTSLQGSNVLSAALLHLLHCSQKSCVRTAKDAGFWCFNEGLRSASWDISATVTLWHSMVSSL